MLDKIALSVDNLSAGYPSDPQAVTGLNFEVWAGERIAVIGPNGAGKSTLFKSIVGLIPFTAGRISIFGEDCRSSHTMVGYVPQQEAIDWSFPVNVYDVVMMGRARHNGWLPFTRRRDREIVDGLLDQLSLQPLARRQIGALSGGQRRRVFIARALAQDTQVLLLDEPFTGVDTSAENEINDTLDLLTQRGITMLLATHDMARAASDFDRVLLLNRHLIAYGTADEVMQPEPLRRAYRSAIQVVSQGTETTIIIDEHGHL